MVIFNSYVSLPEGKFPLSYGFPMVFLWFSPFLTPRHVMSRSVVSQEMQITKAAADKAKSGCQGPQMPVTIFLQKNGHGYYYMENPWKTYSYGHAY